MSNSASRWLDRSRSALILFRRCRVDPESCGSCFEGYPLLAPDHCVGILSLSAVPAQSNDSSWTKHARRPIVIAGSFITETTWIWFLTHLSN